MAGKENELLPAAKETIEKSEKKKKRKKKTGDKTISSKKGKKTLKTTKDKDINSNKKGQRTNNPSTPKKSLSKKKMVKTKEKKEQKGTDYNIPTKGTNKEKLEFVYSRISDIKSPFKKRVQIMKNTISIIENEKSDASTAKYAINGYKKPFVTQLKDRKKSVHIAAFNLLNAMIKSQTKAFKIQTIHYLKHLMSYLEKTDAKSLLAAEKCIKSIITICTVKDNKQLRLIIDELMRNGSFAKNKIIRKYGWLYIGIILKKYEPKKGSKTKKPPKAILDAIQTGLKKGLSDNDNSTKKEAMNVLQSMSLIDEARAERILSRMKFPKRPSFTQIPIDKLIANKVATGNSRKKGAKNKKYGNDKNNKTKLSRTNSKTKQKKTGKDKKSKGSESKTDTETGGKNTDKNSKNDDIKTSDKTKDDIISNTTVGDNAISESTTTEAYIKAEAKDNDNNNNTDNTDDGINNDDDSFSDSFSTSYDSDGSNGDEQNLQNDMLTGQSSENDARELIEAFLDLSDPQISWKGKFDKFLSKDNMTHLFLSYISRMHQGQKIWQENLDINYQDIIPGTLPLYSSETDEIRATQLSYSLMIILSNEHATETIKAFLLKKCQEICLHALAVFHPSSSGNVYHGGVALGILLNHWPKSFMTALTNQPHISTLLKCALFRNLHQGNLNSFFLDLVCFTPNTKIWEIQAAKKKIIKMFVDWKFMDYLLTVASSPKHGDDVATKYGMFFIDMAAGSAPIQEAEELFKGYEHLIIDSFVNGLLDKENQRTIWHRICCGQILIQFLDIASRPSILDPAEAMAGMLGIVPADPKPNIIHTMFEESLHRLHTFIPKMCDMITSSDNDLSSIALSSGVISKPFGQVKLNCLELLALSADFAQFKCGNVLGLLKLTFWESLLDMTFIHNTNNMFLCHFRRLIHLSMIFKRRILKHLFLNCKLLERFVDFYENKPFPRTTLHGYILQMLWDIYNHDEKDNDDDNDDNDDVDDVVLNSNFSKEAEDQWNIISFFNNSNVWKEFVGTVSLEMEQQNNTDIQVPNMNVAANQDQLDQLLSNLLGPTNDDSDSDDSSSDDETIGISVGGSRGINNFRECIKQNIKPSIHSITYNGLLYEYYFDTKTRGKSTKIKKIKEEKKNNEDDDGSNLFYPTYCYAKTRYIQFDDNDDNDNNDNNNNDEYEYYMTVGLNSNIKKDEFKRKHLNLVVVLDKSGSMDSRFADNGNDSDSSSSSDSDSDDDNKSQINNQRQMTVANESIICLLKHLTEKDRFGMISFDNDANIIQKLQFLNNINMEELKGRILSIEAGGGTDFECGYKNAIDLYSELIFENNEYINDEYENRIILLTDAEPNIGEINPDSLLKLVSKYANHGIKANENIHDYPTPKQTNNDNENNGIKHIYTTFIGIGLKFKSSLIEIISSCRGCNYYSVNSTKEFMNKMDDEFEYLVTPLIFNICLKLKSEGNSCQIDKVYGIKDNKKEKNILENGEIIKINTLFPSKKIKKKEKNDNKKKSVTKGGIQLIKLKKTKNVKDVNITISVTFEDQYGTKYENKKCVTFKYKENVNDMIEDEDDDDLINNYYDNNGIRKAILLCKYGEIMMQWISSSSSSSSSSSDTLIVSNKYQNILNNFSKYFKKEMKICDDNDLQKELDILNILTQI